MKFGVVVFPGSNCDEDCFYVLRDVLGQEVEYLWYQKTNLRGFNCLVLPGGFSYGDYLRAGAIARFAPLVRALPEFIERGGLVLGICNGFQLLLEAGLLPGVMMRNTSLRFICKYVHVRVEHPRTPFTRCFMPGEILRLPIAHNEGCYYADQPTLDRLLQQRQIVLRYCDAIGNVTEVSNPNGSVLNIAGICNEEGTVFGLMPHPERSAESMLGSVDGKWMFASIVDSLTPALARR